MGKISGFGLMEISRQRRRTGILEGTTHVCPHCQGAGRVRSVESSALAALRAVEMEAVRGGGGAVTLRAPTRRRPLHPQRKARLSGAAAPDPRPARHRGARRQPWPTPSTLIERTETREHERAEPPRPTAPACPISYAADDLDDEDEAEEDEDDDRGRGRRRRRADGAASRGARRLGERRRRRRRSRRRRRRRRRGAPATTSPRRRPAAGRRTAARRRRTAAEERDEDRRPGPAAPPPRPARRSADARGGPPATSLRLVAARACPEGDPYIWMERRPAAAQPAPRAEPVDSRRRRRTPEPVGCRSRSRRRTARRRRAADRASRPTWRSGSSCRPRRSPRPSRPAPAAAAPRPSRAARPSRGRPRRPSRSLADARRGPPEPEPGCEADAGEPDPSPRSSSPSPSRARRAAAGARRGRDLQPAGDAQARLVASQRLRHRSAWRYERPQAGRGARERIVGACRMTARPADSRFRCARASARRSAPLAAGRRPAGAGRRRLRPGRRGAPIVADPRHRDRGDPARRTPTRSSPPPASIPKR